MKIIFVGDSMGSLGKVVSMKIHIFINSKKNTKRLIAFLFQKSYDK